MRCVLRNITLIGFMGGGKSTVGRLLAQKRGWQFVDTDEVIVEAAGRDIPSLFAEQGEAGFRGRETEAVLQVSRGERQVIATGGGAILRPENVAALRAAGLVVWLTARPDILVARTRRRAAERPLLAEGREDLLTHVLRMLGERGPLYQAAAHLVVDTSDRSPQVVAAEIERKAVRWEDARE
jgi:shikimate kinase